MTFAPPSIHQGKSRTPFVGVCSEFLAEKCTPETESAPKCSQVLFRNLEVEIDWEVAAFATFPTVAIQATPLSTQKHSKRPVPFYRLVHNDIKHISLEFHGTKDRY